MSLHVTIGGRQAATDRGSASECGCAFPAGPGEDVTAELEVDKRGFVTILPQLTGDPRCGETTMELNELNVFRDMLLDQKRQLMENARKTLESEIALDVNELPDDMDFASTQVDQGIILRLRGREKILLKKIEEALQRIESGEYGVCEECSEEISLKRLEARPVTTLCIRCKSEQERKEKLFS